eukprot:GHVU01178339.1.p3 GENE.GHVU01178339.1~~GHVU01178339.1.p3  ORF type:complete len:128 (+),score=14.19 GHVU01178339.1:64-447(+)
MIDRPINQSINESTNQPTSPGVDAQLGGLQEGGAGGREPSESRRRTRPDETSVAATQRTNRCNGTNRGACVRADSMADDVMHGCTDVCMYAYAYIYIYIYGHRVPVGVYASLVVGEAHISGYACEMQ